MSELKNLPTYLDAMAFFNCQHAPQLPAEIHGFMCGILCGVMDAHSHIGFKSVLARLEEEGVDSEDAKSGLAKLMLISAHQLQSPGFEFELLLPADEALLEKRVEALSGWCQSFLSGLGLANLPREVRLNHIVHEAMEDIAEIAKTKYSDDLPAEELEQAFYELVEFVRMAVLLIHTQAYLEHDQHPMKKDKAVH